MKYLKLSSLLSTLCAVALLATACSDSDTDDGQKTVTPPTINIEGLSDSGIDLLYSSSAATKFNITVNSSWEITKTAGWFVVTPNTGRADEEAAEISVIPLPNEGDAREGSFTIRANSGTVLHPCYTEKTYTVKQDKYLGAGLEITGVTNDAIEFTAEDTQAKSFTVKGSYNWTMTVSDESWVTVTPASKSGVADQTITVSATPSVNTTTAEKSSTITIVCADPQNLSNSEERVITLTQAGKVMKDSHAVGTVFFQDNFSWITTNWVSPYTKYGWCTVKSDGTNYNEFAFGIDNTFKAIVDAKGYTYSANVYGHYEGYAKFGNGSATGYIVTPALTGIDAEKFAEVLVTFYAAQYASPTGNVDSGRDYLPISIIGDGTINGDTDTSINMTLSNYWSWKQYAFIIKGATQSTKIKFCDDSQLKSARMFIDELKVVRVAEGSTAPDTKVIPTVLEKEISRLSDAGNVAATANDVTYAIRINQEWSIQSNDSWITINKITDKGKSNGATIAEDKLSATVKGNALNFNNTIFSVAANTGAARTGTLTIKDANSSVIETLTITQSAAE